MNYGQMLRMCSSQPLPCPMLAVISLYQFFGTCEDELSFPIGAIIYVHKINDDGWYEGVMGEKQGRFLGNHVEEVIE